MPAEKKEPFRPGIDPIRTKEDARAYLKQLLKDHKYSGFEGVVIDTFNELVGPEGGFNVIMAIKMALVHHGINSRLAARPPQEETPQGEREP